MSTKRKRAGRPRKYEKFIESIPDYIKSLPWPDPTTEYLQHNADCPGYKLWKYDQQSGTNQGAANPRLVGARIMQAKRLALKAYVKQEYADLLHHSRHSASHVAVLIIKREKDHTEPDSPWVTARGTSPKKSSLRKLVAEIRRE